MNKYPIILKNIFLQEKPCKRKTQFSYVCNLGGENHETFIYKNNINSVFINIYFFIKKFLYSFNFSELNRRRRKHRKRVKSNFKLFLPKKVSNYFLNQNSFISLWASGIEIVVDCILNISIMLLAAFNNLYGKPLNIITV